MATKVQKITTYLWFDQAAEAAVELYTSLFAGSRVVAVTRWGPGGPVPEGAVMNITFELEGQAFIALNGGPVYTFTPAISLLVSCETQAEIDRLWDGLQAGGGRPVACGWVTDRFGLSWQVVPRRLMELASDADRARAGRVMQALMGMQKIDLAALERAHAGA